jgi:hydroxypyruvate isomerase
MPRFAAHLSLMYPEHGFLDRFAAAAADGFEAVEFHFPYEHPAGEIAQRLVDQGLTQVLFNAPPGQRSRRPATASSSRSSRSIRATCLALPWCISGTRTTS